jgi:hypothetical protein
MKALLKRRDVIFKKEEETKKLPGFTDFNSQKSGLFSLTLGYQLRIKETAK